MKFVKMHGCGNDYVLVDSFREKVENPRDMALHLCRRRFGAGADGLILIMPPVDAASADARMRIFNADGSEAEMCGNGIRCMAALCLEKGLGRDGRVAIETPAGMRTVAHSDLPGGGVGFEVDMGVPAFLALPPGSAKPGEAPGAFTVEAGGGIFSGTPVSMGNPHFVVFVEDVDACPVQEQGSRIEGAPCFPDGTNVEFVQVLGEGAMKQRTWERGVGETLACGTGAAAAAAAAIRQGAVSSPVKMGLRGGDLFIRWDGEGTLFLSGAAVEVFRGETA